MNCINYPKYSQIILIISNWFWLELLINNLNPTTILQNSNIYWQQNPNLIINFLENMIENVDEIPQYLRFPLIIISCFLFESRREFNWFKYYFDCSPEKMNSWKYLLNISIFAYCSHIQITFAWWWSDE